MFRVTFKNDDVREIAADHVRYDDQMITLASGGDTPPYIPKTIAIINFSEVRLIENVKNDGSIGIVD